MTHDDSQAPTCGALPNSTERYGVFLTPDAVTCAAVTWITTCVRAQYGFVSAGAFPPHATLAGSLPLRGGEDELLAVLDELLSTRTAVPVQNVGVRVLGDVVIYDVNTIDGDVNGGLLDLALDIDAAVRPLLAPTSGFAADLHDATNFHAHLSLASHDLYARPDLLDEVAAFIGTLPVTVPERFLGDTVTVYRFTHPTWTGDWWRAMRWTHVRTWRLRGGHATITPRA